MNKDPTSSLRIIGGQWRGRRLPIPIHHTLRPTPNAIRETLFNWLAPRLSNCTCLDVFAGSGALGTEALSRGASWVTFLEKSKKIAAMIGQNMAQLNGEAHSLVIHTDALHWLTTAHATPFDIIFIDPPFHHNFIDPVCALIHQYKWICTGGYVYLEHERKTTPRVPKSWQCYRTKTSKHIAYSLYCNT